MSKRWNRMETWLALVVLGVGGLLTLVVGLPVYMRSTAVALHPDAVRATSVTRTEPPRAWAGAVERGRRIVRAGLVDQNLPGYSVAVGADGEVVWAEGFGWTNLERRVPVTPETQFKIGTASTVLTAAAVGLLLEQGRLNLDEEVQVHVPEFPHKQWPVTLRQLLAHVAGVTTDSGDEGPLLAQHCIRPVDALPQFAERDLLFEPGTRFRYSSYGWILVSAAVEAAADEPFLDFMQQQVFEPLGMDDTRADAAGQTLSDRATSYFPRFGADPRYGLHLTRDLDYSCYAGASVFLSTPSDLVRFGMAMNRGTLLQPRTVQLLQQPQQLRSGEDTGYALGWDHETVELPGGEAQMIGHDGEVLGGTVASLMTFPDHDIVVAVLSNISYADTAGVALQIAQAFVDQRRAAQSTSAP